MNFHFESFIMTSDFDDDLEKKPRRRSESCICKHFYLVVLCLWWCKATIIFYSNQVMQIHIPNLVSFPKKSFQAPATNLYLFKSSRHLMFNNYTWIILSRTGS